MFSFSQSAHGSYLHCQQKYAYESVERISSKRKSVPVKRGQWIHACNDNYYSSPLFNSFPDRAFNDALDKMLTECQSELVGYVNILRSIGDDELVSEFTRLPDQLERIMRNYYEVRGRDDAKRYEVVCTEKKLQIVLSPGIVATGYVDLVTCDKVSGKIQLWEHKSTKQVPPDSVRLTSLQVLVYVEMLRVQDELICDSVIWNYIRTKEPAVPEVTTRGVTKRANIDTTWPVYSAALRNNGQNPESSEFDFIRERLSDREETVFFPRYEQVIVSDSREVMREFTEVAKTARRSRYLWETGLATPVRTITKDCDYCEFNPLCRAVITGGDTDDLIRMMYDRSSYGKTIQQGELRRISLD